MAWTIKYTGTAEKQLRKLDKTIARQIVDYMDERVAPLDSARSRGKPLSGPLGSYWRYRVGVHRVICELQDQHLVVLVIRIAHRKDVYR